MVLNVARRRERASISVNERAESTVHYRQEFSYFILKLRERRRIERCFSYIYRTATKELDYISETYLIIYLILHTRIFNSIMQKGLRILYLSSHIYLFIYRYFKRRKISLNSILRLILLT